MFLVFIISHISYLVDRLLAELNGGVLVVEGFDLGGGNKVGSCIGIGSGKFSESGG